MGDRVRNRGDDLIALDGFQVAQVENAQGQPFERRRFGAGIARRAGQLPQPGRDAGRFTGKIARIDADHLRAPDVRLGGRLVGLDADQRLDLLVLLLDALKLRLQLRRLFVDRLQLILLRGRQCLEGLELRFRLR